MNESSESVGVSGTLKVLPGEVANGTGEYSEIGEVCETGESG